MCLCIPHICPNIIHEKVNYLQSIIAFNKIRKLSLKPFKPITKIDLARYRSWDKTLKHICCWFRKLGHSVRTKKNKEKLGPPFSFAEIFVENFMKTDGSTN